MLIDQLQSLSRMINGADRKVGRSASEFLDDLRRELAGIQNEINQTLQ